MGTLTVLFRKVSDGRRGAALKEVLSWIPGRRLSTALRSTAAVAVLALALVPAAVAAKGGNGGGKSTTNTAGWSVRARLGRLILAEGAQPSYGER